MILDRSRFGFGIEMRRHAPNYLNRTHAVRDGHDGVAIHTLARGPTTPFAVNGARGIAKDSIQIKQNG